NSSWRISTSDGVWTILKGSGTEKAFVMPCGRQRSLGTPLPLLSPRVLYSASAHGWNSTSTPAPMPSCPAETRLRAARPPPYPGQVRGSLGYPWRGRRQIGSAVRRAWDSGLANLEPLCCNGRDATYTAARQQASDITHRSDTKPQSDAGVDGRVLEGGPGTCGATMSRGCEARHRHHLGKRPVRERRALAYHRGRSALVRRICPNARRRGSGERFSVPRLLLRACPSCGPI